MFDFLKAANSVCALHTPFYVGGSFVSDKDLPGDIDLCVNLDELDSACATFWKKFIIRNFARLSSEYRAEIKLDSASVSERTASLFQMVKVEDAFSKGIDTTYRRGILRVSL